MSLTGDALTDWLVPLATQLAGAVKEFDKAAVATVLSEARAKGALEGLVVVLAAMVPDDLTGTELLAWMRNPDEYVRLRHHGVGSFAASRLCSYT